jgi:hypothetical protein
VSRRPGPSARVSILYDEFGRERMTFSTANVRLADRPVHFLAVRRDVYPSLEQRSDGPIDCSLQSQELAGIGAKHVGHRAGRAQVGGPPMPGGLQKPALLGAPAAEIIAVEVSAFFASRSAHVCIGLSRHTISRQIARLAGLALASVPPSCQPVRTGERLHPRHILAGSGVDANNVPHFYELRTLNFQSRFRSHLL